MSGNEANVLLKKCKSKKKVQQKLEKILSLKIMKIQHQNFWRTTFVLRGNFIALNSDFKKEETL